jgi:hypothetical protein
MLLINSLKNFTFATLIFYKINEKEFLALHSIIVLV